MTESEIPDRILDLQLEEVSGVEPSDELWSNVGEVVRRSRSSRRSRRVPAILVAVAAAVVVGIAVGERWAVRSSAPRDVDVESSGADADVLSRDGIAWLAMLGADAPRFHAVSDELRSLHEGAHGPIATMLDAIHGQVCAEKGKTWSAVDPAAVRALGRALDVAEGLWPSQAPWLESLGELCATQLPVEVVGALLRSGGTYVPLARQEVKRTLLSFARRHLATTSAARTIGNDRLAIRLIVRAEVGWQRGVDAWVEALREDCPFRRELAASALVGAGAREAVPALVRAVDAPTARVVKANYGTPDQPRWISVPIEGAHYARLTVTRAILALAEGLSPVREACWLMENGDSNDRRVIARSIPSRPDREQARLVLARSVIRSILETRRTLVLRDLLVALESLGVSSLPTDLQADAARAIAHVARHVGESVQSLTGR